jgi:hypothetical protein
MTLARQASLSQFGNFSADREDTGQERVGTAG